MNFKETEWEFGNVLNTICVYLKNSPCYISVLEKQFDSQAGCLKITPTEQSPFLLIVYFNPSIFFSVISKRKSLKNNRQFSFVSSELERSVFCEIEESPSKKKHPTDSNIAACVKKKIFFFTYSEYSESFTLFLRLIGRLTVFTAIFSSFW